MCRNYIVIRFSVRSRSPSFWVPGSGRYVVFRISGRSHLVRHDFAKRYKNNGLVKHDFSKRYKNNGLAKHDFSKRYENNGLAKHDFSKRYKNNGFVKSKGRSRRRRAGKGKGRGKRSKGTERNKEAKERAISLYILPPPDRPLLRPLLVTRSRGHVIHKMPRSRLWTSTEPAGTLSNVKKHARP